MKQKWVLINVAIARPTLSKRMVRKWVQTSALLPRNRSVSLLQERVQATMATESTQLRVGVLGLGAIGTIVFTHLGLLATRMTNPNELPNLAVDAFIRSTQFKKWVKSENRHLTLQGQKVKTLQFCVSPDEKIATVWNAPSVRVRPLEDLTMEMHDPVDVLLVAVKAYDSRTVLQELKETYRHLLKKDALCVLLQNGLGEGMHGKNWPKKWVFVNGVTFIGGRVVEFGHVVTSGVETGLTYLAPIRGINDSQHYGVEKNLETRRENRVEMLARIFHAADLRCKVLDSSAMQAILWRKLIVNAAINPLACLLNAPNRVVASSKASRSCVKMVVDEAFAVAQSEQIELNCSLDELVDEVLEVARNTGSNVCSMLIDLRRGSRTEMDVLTGRIVAGGERQGVATPVNKLLLLLIKALETARTRQVH